MSITTSTFPKKWKEAKVKPLHKGGSVKDLNNFRPISILPVLSKLFEKHAHDSLMKFLNEHKLLYITQSGFRPDHSCETALIHMIDKWLKALDTGCLIGVILVDFCKAFDLVDHEILINKMSLYKISQGTLQWFSSYLSNRKQRVSFKNTISDEEIVKFGVPQGSILGPLLFLLFINDLPFHIDVTTDLYADDTTLYEINKSKEEIETKLQKAMSDLSQWCIENGMVINQDKTKAMLITTRQRRSRIDDSLKILCNNLQLSTVTSEKVLGVQIDNNLLWTEHISKVTKRMSTNIWLLSQVKRYLSTEYRLMFYRSYIQPHIDYANIVWGGATKTKLLKIERLQKRACKLILNHDIENVFQAMNDMKIMTFSERVFLRKAKFMYKVSANITPKYTNDLFVKCEPVISDGNETHVLRSMSADKFTLPKPNRELYKNSMAYSGPVIWNCLDSYVKKATSVQAFHSRCVKWMKT